MLCFRHCRHFSPHILLAPAGVWAEQMGWVPFFIDGDRGLPSLLLPFFAPWNENVE
jgi:hypothetical protein